MKRPVLGHLFGYTVLTVILTAGAAQSLAGSGTVYSDDIVDSTITTPDLKNGAVNGSKILDNSVTGADVDEKTLHPRTFFAQVKADGHIASASPGVTSTRSDTGRYVVDFPRDMTSCTATVNNAAIVGGDPTVPAAQPFLAIGRAVFTAAGSDDVEVDLSGGGFQNTSFVVIAVCP
jgi:hypothetical protein